MAEESAQGVSLPKEAQTSFTVKEVPYFTSRDSVEAEGLSGSPLGFTSVMWMIVKYFVPSIDDEKLADYVSLVSSFRTAAEDNEEEAPFTVNRSAEWLAHSRAVVAFLEQEGITTTKTKTWVDMPNNLGYGHFGVLEYVLRYGPVAIKTNGLGGKEGEGMILALYLDTDGAIVYHDPRGNALTGYSDTNGEKVKYPKEFIIPYVYEGAIPMMLVTDLSL